MESPSQPEVAIVGAGPAGLCLALGLARAGRRVLVLEKEPGTAERSRAPAIWPRTQEVLAGLGVADTLIDAGIVLPRVELWDADRNRVLFTAPLEELADLTPYPQLLILPQSRTEALLLEAVRAQPTAEVRFSSEVVGIDPGADWVAGRVAGPRGENTVRAHFLAGCDGAHSLVRKAIGAELSGETYRVKAALADVEVDGGDALPFPRFTTDPDLAIGIRIEDRVWRLILPFAAAEDSALDRRVDNAVAALLPNLTWRPVWRSEFRLHHRLATRFAAGRVALAGDAAHLNSPVGGQGMNAAIQDTEALVPALLAALDQDSPAPLARYGTERRQQIDQGVNRFTDRLTDLLLTGRGHLLRPALATIQATTSQLPPLRRRMLKNLAMVE